jgi:hypothetical protein
LPKGARTRAVSAAQARLYLAKAQEFLDAATDELNAARAIAATSLAIHSAINAADAVTGARTGRRAAGPDHDEVLSLLADAGADGAAVRKELARLLPLKTKTECEPTDISRAEARKAVERARRCVTVARRALAEK